MSDNRAIYEFAVKYRDILMDPEAREIDAQRDFAENCFELGFKMDRGE